jgi:hypothetical protein
VLEPSAVLLFAVVGFAVVLQQTPRAVTAAPPSAVILPPLCAVVPIMEVIAVVVKVGKPGAEGVTSSFEHIPQIKLKEIKRHTIFNNLFFIMLFLFFYYH